MRAVRIIVGIAVLVLVVWAGGQIGACEIANMSLQEDLRDLASQPGTHMGLLAPMSDEDVSLAIIRHAKQHGIALTPDQVTVRRTNPGATSTLYLAADYTVPLNLTLFSFRLHFTPSSDRGR